MDDARNEAQDGEDKVEAKVHATAFQHKDRQWGKDEGHNGRTAATFTSHSERGVRCGGFREPSKRWKTGLAKGLIREWQFRSKGQEIQEHEKLW